MSTTFRGDPDPYRPQGGPRGLAPSEVPAAGDQEESAATSDREEEKAPPKAAEKPVHEPGKLYEGDTLIEGQGHDHHHG